ncbi:peptidoglycan recognition protein family protein [Streptomyces cyaneogriseus]|uniref:peptidoglycan recognition protein family protein n=1 Tax=Streptomyces cyaneogriseus TaxID=68192 RepID=UPI00069B5C32|nr:N-acetylmuramoyl-L-alanine amidase [Streptomyces cyaneogriseus]
MATPLSPDRFIAILRAEGVRVEEYPDWRTRERDDETGLAFGPVRMILNHHTAGRNSLGIVAKTGVPGLPPPLAHIHLAKDGVATMCSAGRANHAGPMAVNAYQSFRDEKTVHPAPSKASGTIDGNDISYGIETENLGDGKDPYPRAQYDAWVRINAAICREYGWGAESCGCHKETSVEGKVDPRGPVEGYGARGRFEFTPKQFRADVAERLKHPASWSPGATTPGKTTTKEPLVADKNDVKTLFTTDGVLSSPDGDKDKQGNRHWTAESYLRYGFLQDRETNSLVKNLAKQVAALQAAVDKLSKEA